MGVEKLISGFSGIMKSDTGRKVVMIAGFLVMGGIFLSSLLPKKDTDTTKPEEQSPSLTLEQYAAEMESRVSALLSKIDGVGKAEVMVTLESGAEYVYQSEERQSNGTKIQSEGNEQKSSEKQESIVMIEGDNGKKQALVRTELPPKIQGIVVVCEGGDDVGVQTQVVKALTAAFPITSVRVSIAKSVELS